MWQFLRTRYVKFRMSAYVNGELSTTERRFIARQIDEHPACYAVYRQHLSIKQELERELPAFGRADSEQIDQLWDVIQFGLSTPEPAVSRTSMSINQSLRYSIAAAVFVVALLLPLALGTQTVGATATAADKALPTPKNVPRYMTPGVQSVKDTESPDVTIASLTQPNVQVTIQPAVQPLVTPALRTADHQ